MRILMVKTSSMGDVVHAMPIVNDILRHHPDAQIDWLVEAPFAAIPKMHPGVREVITLSWRSQFSSTRQSSAPAWPGGGTAAAAAVAGTCAE